VRVTKETTDLLTLVAAVSAAVVPVALAAGGSLWRWRQSRLEVKHHDVLGLHHRRPVVLRGAGKHDVELWIRMNSPEPVHELDIGFLAERDTVWGPSTGRRVDPSVATVLGASDDDHDTGWRHGRLSYMPPAVKGRQPFRLVVSILAGHDSCGFLSVRDNATGRAGRVRVCLTDTHVSLEEAPPGSPPPQAGAAPATSVRRGNLTETSRE